MKNNQIKDAICDIIPEKPYVGIILGSGLGNIISKVEDAIHIPYSIIPNFPKTSTKGHIGEWVFGYLNGKPMMFANGRFHYYEGFTLEEVSKTVSTIYDLGCKNLFITNAAGCLNLKWDIGEFMLITGYLDYTYIKNTNPLKIKLLNSSLYDKIIKIMKKDKINLKEGIYTWTLGPSYETPSEIQDIILNGGNAVGMSTVPELKLANELNMNIVGISCLTNYGAGLSNEFLKHDSILNVTNESKEKFSILLEKLLSII